MTDSPVRRFAARLVPIVVSGAVGALVGVAGMYAVGQRHEEPSPQRVEAYASFLDVAAKADVAYGDLKTCMVGKTKATARLCTSQRDRVGGVTQQLREQYESVLIYGSADASATANDVIDRIGSGQSGDLNPNVSLLTVHVERFDFDRYRAARSQFARAMCRDLTETPRDECVGD
jgi:hypothetical protein